MALDPRRVKALFNAALDLPDPADRPAFLDRECGGDPGVAARLEELLAAYDRPASGPGATARGGRRGRHQPRTKSRCRPRPRPAG